MMDVDNNWEDDDPVVTEYDVFVSKEAIGHHSQAYVLQFPLRPADRPYEGVKTVRLKPKVKRMQMEVALNKGPNYNLETEPSLQLETVLLQGRPVDSSATDFTILSVDEKNKAVHLLPLDQVLLLRHLPSYLDKERETGRRNNNNNNNSAAASNGGAGPSKEEDDSKPTMTPITVQVKRRETDAQKEARERSYAHFSQQDEADSWQELKHRSIGTAPSARVFDSLTRFAATQPGVIDDEIGGAEREMYVDALVPSAVSLVAPPIDYGTEGGTGIGFLDNGGAGPSGHQYNRGGQQLDVGELGQPAARLTSNSGRGATFPDKLVSELASAMPTFLKQYGVLSLANIRDLLARLPGKAELGKAVQTASDNALHIAVVSNGTVLCIRKSYLLQQLGDEKIDAFRDIVVELLQDKEQLRKSDVMQAAQLQQVAVTDALYGKVLKDLCVSKGSIWSLKAGV